MNNPEDVCELLNLMTAYQKSQVLFSFIDLAIAEELDGKKLSARQIANHKDIDVRAMERFLDACTSLGLLKRHENKYANSGLSEKFLLRSEKFYLGGQVERHRHRSTRVWSKLTKNLKKWKYGEDEESAPESSDQGTEALAEQHNLALLHGFALGKAFDFSGYKKLLDLGGGTAPMSIALCRSYPQLETVVFDLPKNIEVAKKFVEKEKLSHRISFVGGDFQKDSLPHGFDSVLLANLMAVTDADNNKRLLKKLYKKLPVNGVCLLSGWIIDDSRLTPQIPVLFCLEDICWNSPDVERSAKIYTDWLEKANFTKIKCQTYLEPTKMLYGFKT